VLELGEDLLNSANIGAVRRHKEEMGTSRMDGPAHSASLVAAEVAHHHHVTGVQGGGEHLFDIGPEQIILDRAVEDARRVDPVHPQRADEGHRAPVPMRAVAGQGCALRTLTAQRGHVRLRPGFIYEDKPPRVDPVLVALPSGAAAGDVGVRGFSRENGLFLTTARRHGRVRADDRYFVHGQPLLTYNGSK